MNFITTIDNLNIISIDDSKQDLIPIEKLKSYLIWRQKEFLEKYDGVRYNTENDDYVGIQAELKNGKPLIATINSTLLNWDRKDSHPWIVIIEIRYNGQNNNGLPDNNTLTSLNNFENELMKELKDYDGYLNIGRQTADYCRDIIFACKDFRKPSKIIHQLLTTKKIGFEINYNIYKDKYWKSFDRFKPD